VDKIVIFKVKGGDYIKRELNRKTFEGILNLKEAR